ncbi:MAG: hypothetical protein ACHREM_06290 [Polyangiales bacterium]
MPGVHLRHTCSLTLALCLFSASTLTLASPAYAAASGGDKADDRTEELQAEIDAQEARLKALEAKLKSPDATAPAATPAAPTTDSTPRPTPETAPTDARQEILVSGYLQGEVQSHQDSQDQLKPGGDPYNQDRFLVRRARIRVGREYSWSSLFLELDGNSTNGPALNLWHAEVALQYRGANPLTLPPMIKLTAGIFDTPFGFELIESPEVRWFTERSFGSRELFPAEPDAGAKLSGAIGWFRYAVAMLNGMPYGTSLPLRSPHSAKDLVFRVASVSQPTAATELQFGTSLLEGSGFSKGIDATKGGVVWHDDNENGVVDPGELSGVPGQAPIPSADFRHWAVSADARIRQHTPLGWTTLSGEVTFSSNLDRGRYTSDPTGNSGVDYREIGYVLSIQQEIGKYVTLGFRTDYFNPNSDAFGYENGHRVPLQLTVRDYSPLIGISLPDLRSRLVFQYDFSQNHFARDASGVPANQPANAWTLRLQGSL